MWMNCEPGRGRNGDDVDGKGMWFEARSSSRSISAYNIASSISSSVRHRYTQYSRLSLETKAECKAR